MNNFKGFSLHPMDAMNNIKAMIDASIILCASTDEEISQTGVQVLYLVRNYAEAVCIESSESVLVAEKQG